MPTPDDIIQGFIDASARTVDRQGRSIRGKAIPSAQKRAIDNKFEVIKRVIESQMATTAEQVFGAYVDIIEMLSPRDSNRYLRAWQIAANDAGLPARPVLAIKASANRDQYIAALERQVALWAGEYRKHAGWRRRAEQEDAAAGLRRDGTPRARRTKQRWYKDAGRKMRAAQKNLDRAREELEKALKTEGILLIDRGHFSGLMNDAGRYASGATGTGFGFGTSRSGGPGKRRRTTVRDKIYGGEGQITTVITPFGHRTVMTLRNMEPHARIVEKRHQVAATAKALMRTSGVRGVEKSTRDAIRQRMKTAGVGRKAA